MTATTTEATATRDERLAEYVVREALQSVENRIYGALEWEPEIAQRFDALAGSTDGLRVDERLDVLFRELFPDDDSTESAVAFQCSADSCRLAARVLRAIVYEADHLRSEAEHLFKLSREFEAKARDDA